MTTSEYPASRRNATDYEAYLRTPAWKAKRAQALDRALNACQLCESRHGLEVHHRTYANLGNERPADLTVLCSRCHQWHHWRLMMRDQPRPTYDVIQVVHKALREWATRHAAARGDLGELAAAKVAALEEVRQAFRVLALLSDVEPGARAWLRGCLIKQVADAMGYSEELADRMFSLAAPEAIAA